MSTTKFGSFFAGLLKKAGINIDTTDAKYADLLSASLEIPNDLIKQINQGLMDVDAATANEAVQKKIYAKALGSIDNDLQKLVEKHDLKDLPEAYKTEESTRKKLTMVLEALEGNFKKTSTANATEQDKEITRLNSQLKQLREEHTKALGDKDLSHNSQVTDLVLDIMLADYNYADVPGGKPFAIKFTKDQLLNDISGKKGKLVLDGRNLKLVKAETGGDLFDDQNNKVELKGLIDGTLATHKLLKTNDPEPPKKDTIEVPGGGGGAANQQAIGALSTALSQITDKGGNNG